MLYDLFIKKISGSIGSENLSPTFEAIREKNGETSVQLVDMSIKLDFFRDFPYADIKKLKSKLSGNILPDILLKRMTINYLYMFPTTYKEKQKICSTLGISMGTQRAIDISSTQKKRG